MVIEWLKVNVAAELREEYIQKDMEVWTPALEQYPGFLGKEIWLDPDDPTALVILIRWASREQWKSIPADKVEEITETFDQIFGQPYRMVEEKEYQIRKFPHPSSH
jgi:uncharacterized protein (TIGR03792 family)